MYGKKLAGAALAVLLAGSPAFVCPAQPGDVIVSIDFDDGSVDGFETYLEGGACELRNEDGALAADITNCGKVDYANQAYWDGFSLEKDCSYTYSFDISCSIDREIEYRLQLNGGDYHAYVGEKIRIGEEPVHISTDGTMTEESDPAPRLVFNMGHTEDMAEDPGAHTVRIDNISLVVLDDSGVAKEAGEQSGMLLSIDQAGYRPEDEKTVFIRCGETPAEQAAVLDESGAVVMELAPSEVFADAASGSDMQRADFTELSGPGTYRIRAAAGGEESFSEPFVIGSGVYTDLLADTVRMLSLQRCGTEVSLDPAFAHGVCHDSPALILGTDQTKDVSGGWHDAGDYGRYVVAGAKAVSDLFLAFDMCGLDADDLGIPESGNGIPDALDEARWELEWMLKMQDETSGGVYHKVTCRSFPGAVMPEEETDELVICPVSLTATADFAAVMARASVLYAPYDADFAQTARHAAEKAWAYAEDLDIGQGFLNPPEVSTGEYPDTEADDELAWAAAELYLAGALGEGKAKSLLEQTGTHGLGWQCVTDYALIDLAAEEGNALREMAQERLAAYADTLLEQAASDGYYMTLGTDYPWGSNMTAADHGNILLFAARLTGDEKYTEAAKRHLDYLLGANPAGRCYVTGWGSVSPEHPHHRPSQAVGSAMPGMLVGGPDSHLEDPYAQNVLAGEAPARCYVDNDQSYSTNEVTVYWNSPLVLLLAGIVNG